MPELNDHDMIVQMYSVMLGVNGSPGLCKMVEKNTRAITKLWIAVTIISCSIGGGTYGLIELIKGV
jgi:hypothetical protein